LEVANLRRIELSEAIAELPEIGPCDPKKLSEGGQDDLFLCTLGFEDRTLVIPRGLSEGNYACSTAGLVVYSTNKAENQENRDSLLEHLTSVASTVEELAVDEHDFTTQLRGLIEQVTAKVGTPAPKVTFDISAAANRLVMKAMHVLLHSDIRLRIVYSEAARYRPTKQEYMEHGDLWGRTYETGLERGVGDVVISPDHPGAHLDPLPDLVVLFPTFKPDRSRAAVDKIDPSLVTDPGDNIIWLLGVPRLDADQWRTAAMEKINEISESAKKQFVSTFDYRETLERLESIYRQNSDSSNITISPIGSKMQALGTSIFHYLQPETRILFVVPDQYNAAGYSTGCKATWQIDFGAVVELRSSLDRVGTLTIED
jgi:hypothetical protein